jgi:hypothetical protein
MSIVYIVHATFTKTPGPAGGDWIPIDYPVSDEVQAFSTQEEAEEFIREWAVDYLGGYVCDAGDMPPDSELIGEYGKVGARVKLYRCEVGGGGGDELIPFVRRPLEVAS